MTNIEYYFCCRNAFTEDFPYYSRRMQEVAQVKWYTEYQNRAHREQCWRTGNLSSPAVCLRGHRGTVFGAAFLEAPFRPGTIVTGAHLDTTCRGEIRMWLPSRGTEVQGMESSSTTEPVNVDAKEEVTKAGILSLYQLPGTPQIACTTFESGVHILRAVESTAVDSLSEGHQEDAGSGTTSRQKRKVDTMDCLERNFSMNLPDDPAISSYKFYPVLECRGQTAPCAKTYIDKRATILAIPSYDGVVRMYKLPEWITNSSLQENIDDPCYDPDGGACNQEPALDPRACLIDDMEINVSEGGGSRLAKQLPVCSLTMSDSSDKMITGGNDMLVKVWDLQRECIVDRLKGHTGWLWNVKSLDPELHVAMSSSTDGFCRKWDIRAGQCVGEINVSAHGPGKVYPVTGVALRGNGWHMAVGSLDKSVYVLDCRMMKRLYCIGKHEDRVCRAMMHEDTLMTTGWDHTVRLWEFN